MRRSRRSGALSRSVPASTSNPDGARVNAQLIESEDEHHWVLLDHRVTQLVIDRSSIRIQTWSLEGSADVRLAAPFVVSLASGAARRIDPTDTERLAPCLALVGLAVRSVTVTRTGPVAPGF